MHNETEEYKRYTSDLRTAALFGLAAGIVITAIVVGILWAVLA